MLPEYVLLTKDQIIGILILIGALLIPICVFVSEVRYRRRLDREYKDIMNRYRMRVERERNHPVNR